MGEIDQPTPDAAAAINAGNEFFAREVPLIQDYAQGLPVKFTPGRDWAVDTTTGQATYNPAEFVDRGFNQTQALFSTLHEIDHVKEAALARRNPSDYAVWQARREHNKTRRRQHLLDNAIDDVGVNRRVLQFAPALRQDTTRLYREKLFPHTDLTEKPRHLQLAYAILRQAMLPDEPLQVAPEVAEALQALHAVQGKRDTYDVIQMITDPNCNPATKRKLTAKFVDPLFDQLFEQDKQNQKDQPPEPNGGGKGSGQGEGEAAFNDDYDEFEQTMPSGFSEEQVATAAQPGAGSSAADRQAAGYEAEHKVSRVDLQKYSEEFQKVKPYLEPIRVQLRRIVAQRLVPRNRLVSGKKHGVMITPGLVGVAQAAWARGQADIPVFSKFEGRVTREQVPTAFEMSAVLDRSGSMAGAKAQQQQRAAILLMESLQEFMSQSEVRDRLIDPNLYATCEIRSLGGPRENVIIRPFAKELTEQQRVEVFQTLARCTGGATEDYVVLGQIIDEMKQRETTEPGYLARVQSHDIKKIVAVFSDGASSDPAAYERNLQILQKMGVQVVQYRHIDGVTDFLPKMADILSKGLDELCYKDES
jgi:hypothetical protein